jgi:hypothetical protein
MIPVSFPLSTQANFAHDILFFGEFKENCAWHTSELWGLPFSEYLVEGALEQIGHLAVRSIYYYGIFCLESRGRLLEMKGLKTLTIAVDDTDYGRWNGQEHWSVY